MKSDVFQPRFGVFSRCERRYPYVKGCNSGASQKNLEKQVVTCSAHFKEHVKTSLDDTGVEGMEERKCTVGQDISRTMYNCIKIITDDPVECLAKERYRNKFCGTETEEKTK